MTITVSPTELRPTHHIKLSDGSSEVGLILSNNRGDEDELAIRREPYPRSALKTYSGQGTYDDEEPPYRTIAQEDFSAGRGKLIFDEDESRYYDGYRLDTTKPETVILGPQEHYCTGYGKSINQSMPGNVTFCPIYGDTRYIAVQFTASANYTAASVGIWVRQKGNPGELYIALFSDSGDEPNALLDSYSIEPTSDWISFLAIPEEGQISQALTSGTKYWVVVYAASSGDDEDACWEIGCDTTAAGMISADAATWSAETYSPYYRVTNDSGAFGGLFFEYKRALYVVRQEDDAGNSYLYINGDRGVADSNVGNLDRVVDASKTWTADEYNGCIVIITHGPGSEEAQPWRLITDTAATYLTVSPDWNEAHTTETEYVILGSTKWTSLLDIGDICTDVSVNDDYVYFARGDYGGNAILRYQWYNSGGTATERNEADREPARYLVSIRHPVTGKNQLYGATNKRGSPWFRSVSLWRMTIPEAWGDGYYDLGQIVATDNPWDETNIANVTQGTESGMTDINIDASFGTGEVALDAIDATDITRGKYIGFMVKSTVGASSGQVRLELKDGAATEYVNLPALTANLWQWAEIGVSPKKTGGTIDGTAVTGVGLDLTADLGAQHVYIYGGIRLLAQKAEYFDFPSEVPINRLWKYSGSEDTLRENPWIFTENQPYEFQTQNDDAIIPLALHEMRALRSEDNCQGVCVNGVYLWFNLGERIQRYYNRQLDNIGPDLDEGLPEQRRGIPRSLLSYPGRVYAGIDAGTGTSSILTYENSGWHEVYRSPCSGRKIRGLFAQSIPGLPDRLWFVRGDDVVYIHVSLDPLQEMNYQYTHEGHIETGRYYGGRRDISKYWHSVKLATDNLEPVYGTDIKVDYQTDNMNGWVEITNAFDTSPFQEENLSDDNNVYGKWIQFRVRLRTETNTQTPEFQSLIIESLMRIPVKWSYTLNFRLIDQDHDLNGDPDNVGADEKIAILDNWLTNVIPITMYSISSLENNKSVYVEPQSLRKVKKIIKEGREGYLAQISLIGV